MTPKWEQVKKCVVLLAPNLGPFVGKQLRTSRHKALIATLTAARERAGLSQRDLASRLGRAHSFIGKIESGERQLNVLEFCEYAEVLGADAAELLAAVIRRRTVG